MSFILAIVRLRDAELFNFLREADVPPYFATSWLLTWYSHDKKSLEVVARLFDACLASPPYFILYLCAAFVLHNRDKILEVECDFALVHNELSKGVEKWGMDVEEVIALADQLMENLDYYKVIKLDWNLLRLYWKSGVHMFDDKVLLDPSAPFNRSVTLADWVVMTVSRGERKKAGARQLLDASRSAGVFATVARHLVRSFAFVAVGVIETFEFLLCIEDKETHDYVYEDNKPLNQKILRWASNYPRMLYGRVFILPGDKTAALVALGFGMAAWIAHHT